MNLGKYGQYFTGRVTLLSIAADKASHIKKFLLAGGLVNLASQFGIVIGYQHRDTALPAFIGQFGEAVLLLQIKAAGTI